MYQETLQELSSLWTEAVREIDEASQRLRYSLAELSQLQRLFNNMLLSKEQYYPDQAIEETNNLQICGYNHFSDNSPSRISFAPPLDFVSNPSPPVIYDSGYYKSSTNQNRFDFESNRDFESVVLEMIGGGVLPENGKFVEAVEAAGQSLETLFITGSVPKWRNPPVQVSGQRPVMSNYYYRYLNTRNGVYGGLELGSGMLNRSFPCKKARFSLMS